MEELRFELANRSNAEFVVELTLMIAIASAALIGNLMVCCAVFRNKTLRTIPNIYIVTLAISDILMAIFCMPLSIDALVNSSWTKSHEVCQFQGFFCFFLAFTSLQTMTAMAINRYYRVVKPSLYNNLFKAKRVFASVLIVVVLAAFGAGLQLITGWAVYIFHYGKLFCFPDYKTQNIEKGYIAFLDFFYISTPVVIISICYFYIFKTVRNHKKSTFMAKRKNSAIPDQSTTLNVEEVKIAKTLFVTVLAFITCWTPIAIIDMIDTYTSHTVNTPRQIYLTYIYLAYGSSSVNPFIYGILNRAFRKEFLKILKLNWRHQVDASQMNNSISVTALSKVNTLTVQPYLETVTSRRESKS